MVCHLFQKRTYRLDAERADSELALLSPPPAKGEGDRGGFDSSPGTFWGRGETLTRLQGIPGAWDQ